MLVACGVECVVCLGCSRWAWKRCTYVGSDDSPTWPTATPEEFEPVPRVCRAILAVYEPDLAHPQYCPNGGYRMNPSWIVKRATYEETHDQCPPYIIYADHDHREIILAIRGLNLRKESDYKVLMDNGLGMQMFAGGYVHHGLLKAAVWLLDREADTIKKLWVDTGSTYRIVFAGHSLGSGLAALMTVVVVNHRDKIGGVPREKIRFVVCGYQIKKMKSLDKPRMRRKPTTNVKLGETRVGFVCSDSHAKLLNEERIGEILQGRKLAK